MSITDEVLSRLRALPEEKQRLVLHYVETLEDADLSAGSDGACSVEGLWADLGFTVTEEDIAQARKEMWGNFPREEV